MTSPAVQSAPPRSPARVEQIYDEHVTMVWRGLRRLGVPEANIEDAVQDVFLVAHRRLAEFEGRSSIKTWIYGIVLRVAKDHRRAQLRQVHRIERLADILSGSAATQTPVDEAERREANRALHAILAELDDEHREVLVMVDLEEFSMRDAAAVLHLHLRACQRRLRAAHAAFEKKLARFLQPSGRQAP
jgi:RNA polymerase sigma-70 factor, ECF subfamily